ncbi:MAG: selenocysteine-specific translation elongation factor [Ignavibacteria bacterium]|nr:selenocysteine-specific translation elongation factor [Ignavibacteria bacterium]MBT8380826.1 selenocysteine-specific translation elongation factor [Ignavibacteria bacterium]MBT8393018.1 selenocysteine-specific translation elongation factor [Ignavibacteria bacterium]NNL19803.1 selenocysteine-specific translation elongation factor [Ignavibacteriaceae bacterium]
MTNFILGTAGHIDHGKTALIKALTGFDCDTHPEEKQRGITINLGFSHLDLPDDNSIGIVDVPGHQNFVNTMVAGAHGIDILLLVIAADSGIMQQTIEHLQIAESLGIKKGFVVLTKIDLVDQESIAKIENDIKDSLEDSFLEGCTILRTSAVTGEGIESIKKYLMGVVEKSSKIENSKIFRMYIDRIFSVAGFGTVVTGSALGGMIKKDDKLFLLPANKELRIRKIERHGKEVQNIATGNRVSLNLVGLSKEEFKRGMLLSDRFIEPTLMIDVQLSLFKYIRPIGTWSDVIFLTGTYSNQASMHLIDKSKATGGETVIAQIHLSEPCVVLRGDRFIIRNTSGLKTLGGGEIFDANPLHHKRRTEKTINQLRKISNGDNREFIFSEVRKKRKPVSLKNNTEEFFFHANNVTDSVNSSLPDDISLINTKTETYLILSSEKKKIAAEILGSVENFHKQNAMLEKGRTADELSGVVNKYLNDSTEIILKSILSELVTEQKLKQIENTWSLYNHSAKLDDKLEKQVGFIEKYFKNSNMHVPLHAKLVLQAKTKGIDEKRLNQIIKLLTSENKLIKVESTYIHSSIVRNCRKKLLNYFDNHSDGITVAAFRDLIKGNRKICLLLLNLFDSEETTFRDGDLRRITEKGKEQITENG